MILMSIIIIESCNIYYGNTDDTDDCDGVTNADF